MLISEDLFFHSNFNFYISLAHDQASNALHVCIICRTSTWMKTIRCSWRTRFIHKYSGTRMKPMHLHGLCTRKSFPVSALIFSGQFRFLPWFQRWNTSGYKEPEEADYRELDGPSFCQEINQAAYDLVLESLEGTRGKSCERARCTLS